MKVYALFEYDKILGIYSTEEMANSIMHNFFGGENCSIAEYELDSFQPEKAAYMYHSTFGKKGFERDSILLLGFDESECVDEAVIYDKLGRDFTTRVVAKSKKEATEICKAKVEEAHKIIPVASCTNCKYSEHYHKGTVYFAIPIAGCPMHEIETLLNPYDYCHRWEAK